MPTVYIIAGPNGAGKTTFAREFLPLYVHCPEFLNVDSIAAGVSPFDPTRGAQLAGRVLLQRIDELSEHRRDFGFETTLAGRSYSVMLRKMKDVGYKVELFFLWLPGPDLAVQRVARRVEQGGHHVPEADVRRRYTTGVRNLLQLYRPLLDIRTLFDSSQPFPRRIAREEEGTLTLFDSAQYHSIVRSVTEA